MVTAYMAHLHAGEVAFCDGEVRVHITPHVLPALLPVPVHIGALQGAVERLHACTTSPVGLIRDRALTRIAASRMKAR